MRGPLILFLMGAISLGLGGCGATQTVSTRDEPIFLKKGMEEGEVVKLIGEPKLVKARSDSGGTIKTWIYEESRSRLRQVQAETREVPYIHPITGEEGYITEPVNKIKRDQVTLVTELYMLDGKLIGWKESIKESSIWDE